MEKDILIKFTRSQRARIIKDMQFHFEENIEYDLKNLQGELLLDYITKTLGPYYYNKGIEDSMKYFNDRIDDMFLLIKNENFE